MKGVIYARYSSDNQREESIEGQLRECKDYAERNGITILGTYIDRALSAKTDNRPEFQKMIKDSAKGLFDVVLVWKLDRFARNRYDSARYKNLLKKNGVKVISARENISEGSEGIILEAMLEGYAEYYSAELSEKVIRGLTDNALKCKYNGGTVPMGYYIDEQQFYQIDPKTAPVVLEMFTKYSEGATMQELVNLLNSRGMRSIRGGKITLNIMNHLLKNRRYIGEYSYRDVVKEDGIPAIVPKELFERVQERLAKNKKAPARHKAEDDYLLTTKLYCGKCGSFMVGESGTSHTMKVHRYYRCVNTKKKKLCDKKAVKKDLIEDLVVSYTMKAIMNDEVMERLIDTLMELQKRESTDLPLLKKQLAETEKGINNMLNAIQAGIFTPSTKQRLDELEETKSQLEVSILQEEMHKPLLTREQIAFFIYRFRKFDVTKREQRQRLIDSFVNAVYLYEDKIILTFNYKDGSKTITLAEVEGSDLSVLGAPKAKKQKALSLLLLFYQFTALDANPNPIAPQTGCETSGARIGTSVSVAHYTLGLHGCAGDPAEISPASGQWYLGFPTLIFPYSMAEAGQEQMHAMQWVQFPFHVGLPRSIVMFRTGHRRSHLPQPMHAPLTVKRRSPIMNRQNAACTTPDFMRSSADAGWPARFRPPAMQSAARRMLSFARSTISMDSASSGTGNMAT